MKKGGYMTLCFFGAVATSLVVLLSVVEIDLFSATKPEQHPATSSTPSTELPIFGGTLKPEHTGAAAKKPNGVSSMNLKRRLRPENGESWRPGVRFTSECKLTESGRLGEGMPEAYGKPLDALRVEVSLPLSWSQEAVNSGKQFPILVFLHGRGESGDFETMNSQSLPRLLGGDDRTDELHHGPNKTFVASWPFITLMPQCPSWCAAQNGWKEPEFQALLELIGVTAAELGGDLKHTYLAGQSMGGAGAWEFAARHPDTFAAVAAMCSYCPLRTRDCSTEIADALKDKPVWIFHAANDVVSSLQV
jgi:predicted esterase